MGGLRKQLQCAKKRRMGSVVRFANGLAGAAQFVAVHMNAVEQYFQQAAYFKRLKLHLLYRPVSLWTITGWFACLLFLLVPGSFLVLPGL